MRRHVIAVVLAAALVGCAGPVGTATPPATPPPATPHSSLGSGSTGPATESCIGGLAQATCDAAARVALAAVVPSGWTPTWAWIDGGQFCPRQDCLFDPSQNFPYPEPPNGGQWVGNAEIAFAGTDQHAGLNIAEVAGALVPVLIGYRVPLLAWCSGGCPSSASTDGVYKLELVLPRLTWNVGDPISGTAILSLTDSQPRTVYGSGELIAFTFDEVGGNRRAGPLWDLSCSTHPLDPASPTSIDLYKSGSSDTSQPDADFLRSFLADPQIHLPAGTWDITAIADFNAAGCSGAWQTIKATVRIHVTG